MKFIKKPFVYASLFGTLLTGGFTYSILKTFVISEAITTVASTTTATANTTSSTAATTATNVTSSNTSY